MKEIISRAMDQGGRLRVRSALNPALWLCAIVSMPTLLASALIGKPSFFLNAIIFIPIAIASVGYLFLLLFDRDKLQSEDYQIRKKSLEMIEQSDGNKQIDISDIDAIANPRYDAGNEQSNE